MATTTSGISVLMPVYNGEPFVGEAIQSILRQTHRDLELVVVDDGSTDGTAKTLDDYSRRDPRVRVMLRPHRGIVSALNMGLRDCRHHLVARMDADDIAHPRRLEAQLRYLAEHADCVALGSQVRHIDAAGADLAVNVVPTQHAEIVDETIRRRCGMWHPSVTYRREAVLKIGGYRAECEWAEDLDLWLRLSEVGRLANLKEPLLSYRIHDHKVCHLRIREQRVLGRRIVREFCETRGLPIPARCRPSWSQLWRDHAWDAIAKQRPTDAAICGLRAIFCRPWQQMNYHVTLLALRNAVRQIGQQSQGNPVETPFVGDPRSDRGIGSVRREQRRLRGRWTWRPGTLLPEMTALHGRVYRLFRQIGVLSLNDKFEAAGTSSEKVCDPQTDENCGRHH